MSGASALEAAGLGRRYGSQWALHDCTLDIPAGSVTALVGPNGAGKTTLLRLAVGLTKPSAGSVRVLDLDPRTNANALLPRIGFVGQEHPLYGGFSVAETLRLGRRLNPHWDENAALARVEALRIPLRKRIRELSGGQCAQVALTLAVAKRPELLLLDEPVASLDPLARRQFMRSVLQAVTDTEMTVVLSSHIVADLERICDHLVILAEGRTQLAGPIDELLAAHRLLTGPRERTDDVSRVHEVIHESHTERQTTLLVRADGHVYDSRWTQHELSLEEVVLAYLGQGIDDDHQAVAS